MAELEEVPGGGDAAAKLVEPTLVTRAWGSSTGSTTTIGTRSLARAARCRAVNASTTAITARRPSATSSSAQAVGFWARTPRRARERVESATATSASTAASSTPWTTSVA